MTHNTLVVGEQYAMRLRIERLVASTGRKCTVRFGVNRGRSTGFGECTYAHTSFDMQILSRHAHTYTHSVLTTLRIHGNGEEECGDRKCQKFGNTIIHSIVFLFL